MGFGSCCVLSDGRLINMNAKSIKIEGFQRGFLVNFEIIQTFTHSENKAKEVYYVFSNDLKICIYDTIFVVGQEIIKPKLQPKEEAKKTYDEAVKSGRTAIYGSNIGHGATEFKLGNVQPDVECKVILKVAFTAQLTKEKTFFIKFPLDIYTPISSMECLKSSNFMFKIQSDKEMISKITSNVKNGQFNESEKQYIIPNNVENNDNEKSIIITFETKEPIQSSALLTPSNISNYDGCALLLSPNLPPSEITNSEFIFVVDCSASMGGKSIQRASECLELFIRSLPSPSYFNVICFGSQHKSLFTNSEPYNEQTATEAINLAQNLKADLGGTDIYTPLKKIFESNASHHQRQIFVMTDGEVFDVVSVLNLISEHSKDNRVFTIGIGRGCDAGLVEGMANSSGGKSDFVQEGDSISEKVIPQLQSSLHSGLSSIEIHVEGEESDAFEVSPFPLPSVNASGSFVIYLRARKSEKSRSTFENGILVTGGYGENTVEVPVQEIVTLEEVEEDELGCSSGRNVSKAILPLFAFSILQKYGKMPQISNSEREKAIELSLSSGVLCKFTALVGMTETKEKIYSGELFKYAVHGRTKQTARRCTGGCTPRKSPNAKMTPTTKESEESMQYSLLTITRFQKFEGFWEDLEAVQKLAGLSVNRIDEVNVSDKNVENNCIATILAVAAIRIKSADEKNSWTMIVCKAVNWLKKTLPNVDIEKVISRIEKMIQT